MASKNIPDKIYRGGRYNDSAIKDIRIDADGVSFRDSLSNPLPEPGKPPQPVLRPGKPYIEVDTSKLPPGSVIPDGGTVVKGNKMPYGHVSVKATPEEIVYSGPASSAEMQEEWQSAALIAKTSLQHS